MKKRKPKENAKPKRAGRRRISAWIHTSSAKCALIVFVGSILVLAMFCFVCAPQRYDLRAGTISRYTITAPKDVIDEVTTQERRDAAAASVEPSYHLAEGVSEQVLADLNATFAELRMVQQYGLTLRNPDDTPETIRTRQFTDDEISYAQAMVTTMSLSRYQATTLMRTETADFDTMVTTVNMAVENALNQSVREGQVKESISTITTIVGYRVELSLMQNIVPTVLRTVLRPNMVIDQEATDLARQAAMDQVENVVYQQGQNIIRAGERVSPNQVEMLRALGLLENNDYDFSGYLGGLLLVLAGICTMLLMLRLLRPELLLELRKVAVLMSVVVIAVALGVIMVKYIHSYFAPMVLAALLLTALMGWHAGLAGTVGVSIIISGLAVAGSNTSVTQMVNLLLMGLVGGGFSVWFVNGKSQRMRSVLCSLIVAVIDSLLILSIGLMTSSDMVTLLNNIPWALGGALLGGLAAVGLQPVFEGMFNLATPSKLMELGNQNHPLLRRLMLEAPGTYHHSMIVANLAEAAATRIGANALLARTSAYFHDVGKLKRPHYFKENQMGVNPLNQTDPYVSAAIVTSHTRDGLQLAQKYHLPPEIQQIIVEHHGDTPVMYFYHKALQQAGGSPVDIADFRYDSTRPATKEAAIIMLADTIEAAVRSMSDPTPKAIEEFIERLVRGKLEDGQLSNSPLTFKDLDEICDAFVTVLNGVFHERIEYPTTEVPKRSPSFAQHADEPANASEPAPAQETEETSQAPAEVEPETPAAPEAEQAEEVQSDKAEAKDDTAMGD